MKHIALPIAILLLTFIAGVSSSRLLQNSFHIERDKEVQTNRRPPSSSSPQFIRTGSLLEPDYHIYSYETPGSSDAEEINFYGDFRSAHVTFINGEMVGTILLSQAFIEHWLQAQLEGKGYVFGRSKEGLSYIVKCLREKKLLHGFLIDKIDSLRKLRNPFVHLRPFDDPQEISRRSVDAKRTPDQVLEGDAKEALSLMYRIAITRI